MKGLRLFSANSQQTPKEEKFDYNKKNFYQILQVEPSISDRHLKAAYFKLAKMYHPDVYKGINQDHFKRVADAYATLKNPVKRAEYDQRLKLKTSQSTGVNEDIFDQKEQTGPKVREEQDPEFEAAFQKLNTQRLFNQFMARPMRSDPSELQEQIMQPIWHKKMSKRDLARQQFIREFRRRKQIDNSIRYTIEEQLEKIRDAEEGTAQLKQMNYHELVEEINKDMKAIEYIDKPLMLYKDEKAQIAEIKKQQDESLHKLKKVVFPFWSAMLVVNGLLLIGFYYQDKLIMKGQQRLDRIEKFESYQK